MLMKHSPTTPKPSVRIMLALLAAKGFPIFTRDLGQAYVSTDATLL